MTHVNGRRVPKNSKYFGIIFLLKACFPVCKQFRMVACLKEKVTCSQQLRKTVRGVCAVIGGILIHLTLGNLYSFGNMMTYMASYMHERVDSNISYGNFIWVNSITTAAQGLFMVFGGLMERRFGPKLTCFIGCSLLSAGIMLTYYAIEVSLFSVILTYGLLSGLGISLSYVTPLACGMQWYPQKKGLVNGLIVAGFGLGALFSTTFQTLYLNPQNEPPEASGVPKALTIHLPYDSPLVSMVPFVAMSTPGELYFIIPPIIILSHLPPYTCHTDLLHKPELLPQIPPIPYPLSKGNQNWQEGERLLNDLEQNESFNEPPSTAKLSGKDLKPVEVIFKKTFVVIWLMYLFTTIAVGYINAMYKSFGQTFITDDHFLAVIGSLAAIFNAGGRIAWGYLMDKTSFRVAMRILATLLALLFAIMPLAKYMGKLIFTLLLWLIFFTFSGIFVLMPTVTEKAFGAQHYSANYGLLFTSQTISGPLMAAVNQLMLNAVGYSGCFLTISGIISFSVILTFCIPDGL
ncbi:apicoplast pyruvate carrier 1-like [Panulirus ornatus]|uniref:apicoplast pyruvate carrier 1-like n=1 Tax=Panulirus ornatus TaxID=150431 RepID=UPI003A8BAB8F